MIGAGLASQVPNGRQAARQFRRGIDDDPDDAHAFDVAVADLNGGAAYQAAYRLVRERRGSEVADSIVRSLVLSAHQPSLVRLAKDERPAFDERYLADAEADASAWAVPRPIDEIAQLLARGPGIAPGPIVTTNFDPLIEIALEKHGLRAASRTLSPGETTVDESDPGAVPVLHLHGYWGQAETLATRPQTAGYRDLVAEALERALAERTLVILGYGGWDRELAQALADALARHSYGDFDVLWALHDDDDAEIATRYGDLIESFQRLSGRISFFRGVDAYDLMTDVLDGLHAGAPTTTDDYDFSSPLAGWTAVSGRLRADEAKQATAHELDAYLDGRAPTWRHVLTRDVALREETPGLVTLVLDDERQGPFLYRIGGPAGEGKTTIALQAATRMCEQEGWRVLWLERATSISAQAIDPVAISSLDPKYRWLLVLDDVDGHLESVYRALHACADRGAQHVCLLVTSRDSDWQLAQGDKRNWSRVASMSSIEVAPSSTRDGATIESRQRARHGDEHVRSLLLRLQERPIRGGGNLLRPFLVIAAANNERILTLPQEVLAEVTGVPMPAIYEELIWPLGREGAVSPTASSLVTRYPALADGALVAMPELGESPGDIYYELIRGTLLARRKDVYIPDMSRVLYLPRRLADGRAGARAAEALTDLEPERYSFWTTRCSCLRQAGLIKEALRVAQEGFSRWDGGEHPESDSPRNLLASWAVCLGIDGKPAANAYLSLVSLADGFGSTGLNPEMVSAALYASAVGTQRIDDGESLSEAPKAAAALWRHLPSGSTGADSKVVSAMRGMAPPADVSSATNIDVLAEAARTAWQRLELRLPDNVPAPPLTFSDLRRFLD